MNTQDNKTEIVYLYDVCSQFSHNGNISTFLHNVDILAKHFYNFTPRRYIEHGGEYITKPVDGEVESKLEPNQDEIALTNEAYIRSTYNKLLKKLYSKDYSDIELNAEHGLLMGSMINMCKRLKVDPSVFLKEFGCSWNSINNDKNPSTNPPTGNTIVIGPTNIKDLECDCDYFDYHNILSNLTPEQNVELQESLDSIKLPPPPPSTNRGGVVEFLNGKHAAKVLATANVLGDVVCKTVNALEKTSKDCSNKQKKTSSSKKKTNKSKK